MKFPGSKMCQFARNVRQRPVSQSSFMLLAMKAHHKGKTRQFTYKVTLKRVRESLLNSKRVRRFTYPVCNAQELRFYLWSPAVQYPSKLSQERQDFQKNVIDHKRWVLILSANLV